MFYKNSHILPDMTYKRKHLGIGYNVFLHRLNCNQLEYPELDRVLHVYLHWENSAAFISTKRAKHICGHTFLDKYSKGIDYNFFFGRETI